MQPNLSSSTPPETIATDIVARIAEIASSLLRVEEVEATSDFFALGGNSLLGAQLVFRLQEEYRVELSVKDIFATKTMSGIAELVHARILGRPQPQAQPQPQPQPGPAGAPPPSTTAEVVAVTAQQRSVWLLEQSPAGKAVSNVAIVFSYRGAIDHPRLEACVRELVERHLALRTVYVKQGPAVVQRIKSYVTLSSPLVELVGAPDVERSAALAEIKAQEITRPFDLERDAKVRLTHVRFAADAGELLFSFHHIAVDDRSLEVFFAQLEALYASADLRQVPGSGRSFLDYCREEAGAEAEGDRAESLEFWRAQLEGMSGTAYPGRGRAASERAFAGHHHYYSLSPTLSASLDAAAARRSTTAFGLFAAGVIYLLHRATGRDDVCVAALMSRRDHFTDDAVIGCFVNSVPLRARIDRDGTLEQLIEVVLAVFFDAYAHRHVAFEDMIEAAALEPGGRGRALPVTINLEAEKLEELSLGAARLRREPLDRGVAKRDLVLSLRKVDGCYRVLVEHHRELYTSAEVELLCANLEAALEQLITAPSAWVGEQLIAPPRTMATTLAGLGWTRARDYEPVPVTTLIGLAADAHEDKPAIVGASGRLSYRELAQRSDAVASALIESGVEPGEFVAVVDERHVDTIAALLGIWKAGAAYVVLDITQPAEALRRLVDACRPTLVLGHRRALADAASLGLPTLELATASATPIDEAALAQRSVTPEATAYVCFTSGSSGIPKGVAVNHAAITRVVRRTSYAALGSDDVLLNISPLSFDGSVFEVWAPLANGGTLRLMHDGVFSLDDVAATLGEGRVSVFFVTTALFNALVDHKLEVLLKVPTILFGGEKASRAHVERLIEAGYTGDLRNIYGPTEATVFATSHAVSKRSLALHPGAIPIGVAHNDTSVAVVVVHDRDGRRTSAPCGIIGELAIGGPGVAQGYLHDAPLTSARFVQLALAGNADRRFYLTGDRGYFDANGELHFVGRQDRQVKVSGYRLELDELEAVIGGAPAVNGCHCRVLDEALDELVAFVGYDRDRGSPEAIKAHVRSQLPAYKVPARFVFVAQLPLNINGKVDVDALAQLDRSAAPRVDATAATVDVAEAIREVWRNELGADNFSDDDSFFDVGGTSLKIMLVHDELAKRLRELGLDVELEITHLFEFATVATLTEFLEDLAHAR